MAKIDMATDIRRQETVIDDEKARLDDLVRRSAVVRGTKGVGVLADAGNPDAESLRKKLAGIDETATRDAEEEALSELRQFSSVRKVTDNPPTIPSETGRNFSIGPEGLRASEEDVLRKAGAFDLKNISTQEMPGEQAYEDGTGGAGAGPPAYNRGGAGGTGDTTPPMLSSPDPRVEDDAELETMGPGLGLLGLGLEMASSPAARATIKAAAVRLGEEFGIIDPKKGSFSSPEEAKKTLEDAKKKGVRSPGPGAAGIARTAWGKFPENLRPEILAGGLQVYPQGDYNKMLDDAVASGQINPQQRKMASNAYKKWTRTLWGATVDHNRLSREMKWIGGREQADVAMIRSNEAAQAAQVAQEMTESIKDYEGEYRAYQSEYRADYDRMLVKQDEAIDELSQMRIDPDRWFASKGTGGQIMAVIGMGLGSLGASFSKGPNWAFQMIQSQIGNDLAAQRTDIGTVQTSIRSRSNLIGFFDRRLKNLDQSTKMSRLFLNDYYTSKIRLLGANATSEVQRRHYESLMEMMAKDREVLGAGVRKGAALLAQQRARAWAMARARKKGNDQPGILLKASDEGQMIPIGNGEAVLLKGIAPAEMTKLRGEIKATRAVAQINAQIHAILERQETTMGRITMGQADRLALDALSSQMLLIAAEPRGKNFTELERKLVTGAGAGTEEGRFARFYKDIIYGRKEGGKLILPSDTYVANQQHLVNATMGNYAAVRGKIVPGMTKPQTGEYKGKDVPAMFWYPTGKPGPMGTHTADFSQSSSYGWLPKGDLMSGDELDKRLGTSHTPGKVERMVEKYAPPASAIFGGPTGMAVWAAQKAGQAMGDSAPGVIKDIVGPGK